MKAIHPNSVAAYWQGRDDLFGKRLQKVIAALRASRDPLTDREVMVRLGFADPNAVRPRISELVDAGIAQETGRVLCPVTRKTVRFVRLAPAREVQADFFLKEVLTPALLRKINQKPA
jgi:predicted transcriptional regulator